jgi:hypothetical protein
MVEKYVKITRKFVIVVVLWNRTLVKMKAPFIASIINEAQVFMEHNIFVLFRSQTNSPVEFIVF